MSLAESEKMLDEVRSVRNVASDMGLKPARRYLRHNEKDRRETEARRLRETLDPMNIRIAGMGEHSVAAARKHLSSLQRDLKLNSPPTDLGGDTKDTLYAEQKRLEAEISAGMLTQEEMRRNPVGAVDRHIKWEKANKENILVWKNIKLALNPDSEEQDLCNVEQLRKSGLRPDGVAGFDPNAQIAGHFAMTQQAKANWPEGMPEFGEVNSPWKQAMEREVAELREHNRLLEEQLKTTDPHNSPKSFKMWTCPREGCGQEMKLFKKGVHMAKHKRMDADEVKMQKEVDRLEAARLAREAAERGE